MAISNAAAASAALSVSGVRAANEQVRVLGQGLSSLLAVAEQIADQVPGSAATPAVPVDAARGQSVDVSA
ncbi:hypothetical protein T8K17_20630 [Thalassobaculum sp. OXR-137]|uniref:hypothetical protein n=1 Tax=Thalassobaculum sp. OXR-137 TaxID=3100173 RepID=UPI002AC89C22|nr:hypothetical protein [Thalassobaculum sp. OXR-137]WPZ33629.1 hypothetical protein T8K17_20630 [Thalassobaculum sp. OXR-137]